MSSKKLLGIFVLYVLCFGFSMLELGAENCFLDGLLVQAFTPEAPGASAGIGADGAGSASKRRGRGIT